MHNEEFSFRPTRQPSIPTARQTRGEEDFGANGRRKSFSVSAAASLPEPRTSNITQPVGHLARRGVSGTRASGTLYQSYSGSFSGSPSYRTSTVDTPSRRGHSVGNEDQPIRDNTNAVGRTTNDISWQGAGLDAQSTDAYPAGQTRFPWSSSTSQSSGPSTSSSFMRRASSQSITLDGPVNLQPQAARHVGHKEQQGPAPWQEGPQGPPASDKRSHGPPMTGQGNAHAEQEGQPRVNSHASPFAGFCIPDTPQKHDMRSRTPTRHRVYNDEQYNMHNSKPTAHAEAGSGTSPFAGFAVPGMPSSRELRSNTPSRQHAEEYTHRSSTPSRQHARQPRYGSGIDSDRQYLRHNSQQDWEVNEEVSLVGEWIAPVQQAGNDSTAAVASGPREDAIPDHAVLSPVGDRRVWRSGSLQGAVHSPRRSMQYPEADVYGHIPALPDAYGGTGETVASMYSRTGPEPDLHGRSGMKHDTARSFGPSSLGSASRLSRSIGLSSADPSMQEPPRRLSLSVGSAGTHRLASPASTSAQSVMAYTTTRSVRYDRTESPRGDPRAGPWAPENLAVGLGRFEGAQGGPGQFQAYPDDFVGSPRSTRSACHRDSPVNMGSPQKGGATASPRGLLKHLTASRLLDAATPNSPRGLSSKSLRSSSLPAVQQQVVATRSMSTSSPGRTHLALGSPRADAAQLQGLQRCKEALLKEQQEHAARQHVGGLQDRQESRRIWNSQSTDIAHAVYAKLHMHVGSYS